MKLNLKILKAINEGIRKSLLSFDDVLFDQSTDTNLKVSKSIVDWKWIQDNCVDLDLPSGNLWMNHNLGATCGDTANSWVGNYYAWGETNPKSIYDTYSYKFFKLKANNVFTATKYIQGIDNINELELCDDAAYQFDNRLCIPSPEDFMELLNNTFQYVLNEEFYNDVPNLFGCLFVSRKDNTKKLLIPFSSIFIKDKKSTHNHSISYVWTSSIGMDHTLAKGFYGDLSGFGICNLNRDNGLPIRAIYKKEL